ncbi:MAG: hypothetical protein ACOC44_06155 [Promethearchaeia archaeon]
MENSLIIRQVKEQEYDEMLKLQWEILFKPYGKELDTFLEILNSEANKIYSFVALIDSSIEGAARLHQLNEKEGKIEFLAIKKESEINRVGPSIINFIEWYARGLKLDKVLGQARKEYQRVFEKCKYEKKGTEKALIDDIENAIWAKKL